ncbi:MAG: hypothetical protein LUH82_05050, partial [Clostridiales bacterium]|nr:hypothetical protein [Clostridiales bacterium]
IEIIDSAEDETPAAPEIAPPAAQKDEESASPLPFESFFNVNHGGEQTNEKISLIAPDEEEDDALKFRGFFKKKKDKNK